MKLAKASKEEAEALLDWLQRKKQETKFGGDRPPAFTRTIFGYLLLLEHCADPAKDYIDWKPGTSPQEIDALKRRAEAAEAELRKIAKLATDQTAPDKHCEAVLIAMDAIAAIDAARAQGGAK